MEPLVLDFKDNSLDDGPGIRSVVFFKGCPLSCVWCHNPESHKRGKEISFDSALCVGCGACQKVCPVKALAKDNPFYIDRTLCNLCFKCAETCPSGALTAVGKVMTVEEIVQRVLPDQPFFDASGGGVTLSGGEPMLFMEFSSALLKRLKSFSIHTLIETCGFFEINKFMELIYPYVDAIYYDLKIMDSAKHERYCGLPNEKILNNFKLLVEKTKGRGKVFLVRTPLIPGITDSEENLKAIARFLKEQKVSSAALLPYNPLWHEKNTKLGKQSPLKDDPALTSFSEQAVITRAQQIFEEAEVTVYKE